MNDLFGQFSQDGATRLALPGAEACLFADFLDAARADHFFASLLHDTAWSEQKVFVHGKWHFQPRLVAWYGDDGATYSYSGNTMSPAPWTRDLSDLRNLTQEATGAKYNSVLLNLYRNEHDRMGWHSDNEAELGPRPTIASVSLGATRVLLFKPRKKTRGGVHRIALSHGSLLLMAGDTQSNWRHAVYSESCPCGARINLTFRFIHRAADRRSSRRAVEEGPPG